MVTLILPAESVFEHERLPAQAAPVRDMAWPVTLRDMHRTKERKANVLSTETSQFVRALADKLAELTSQRQGRDRIVIGMSADEVAECLLAADRDIAFMDLGRMS